MDAATVVAKMCGEEFTAADFQAVCRNRGFSVKAAGSPKLLENLLLSEAGLAAAFAALTRDEVVLLHLLRSHSRPVDLPFFHRVYGADEHAWTRTFTEKYKETFKNVRASLIRRGVLFFADRGEDPVARKPKLERLLFPTSSASPSTARSSWSNKATSTRFATRSREGRVPGAGLRMGPRPKGWS